MTKVLKVIRTLGYWIAATGMISFAYLYLTAQPAPGMFHTIGTWVGLTTPVSSRASEILASIGGMWFGLAAIFIGSIPSKTRAAQVAAESHRQRMEQETEDARRAREDKEAGIPGAVSATS